jgi:hypothetical protein
MNADASESRNRIRPSSGVVRNGLGETALARTFQPPERVLEVDGEDLVSCPQPNRFWTAPTNCGIASHCPTWQASLSVWAPVFSVI